MGLAFVAMSRTRDWASQGFRNLPDFWEFRRVLKDKLFLWRKRLEERMDRLHDETMSLTLGRSFRAQEDVAMHQQWTEKSTGTPMSADDLRDLEEMLAVRGLREPPTYTDEPQQDRSAPKGGGGRRASTVLGLSETKTGNKLFKLTHMIVCFSMISGTMKRCL